LPLGVARAAVENSSEWWCVWWEDIVPELEDSKKKKRKEVKPHPRRKTFEGNNFARWRGGNSTHASIPKPDSKCLNSLQKKKKNTGRGIVVKVENGHNPPGVSSNCCYCKCISSTWQWHPLPFFFFQFCYWWANVNKAVLIMTSTTIWASCLFSLDCMVVECVWSATILMNLQTHMGTSDSRPPYNWIPRHDQIQNMEKLSCLWSYGRVCEYVTDVLPITQGKLAKLLTHYTLSWIKTTCTMCSNDRESDLSHLHSHPSKRSYSLRKTPRPHGAINSDSVLKETCTWISPPALENQIRHNITHTTCYECLYLFGDVAHFTGAWYNYPCRCWYRSR
jgi:hypothetical protein